MTTFNLRSTLIQTFTGPLLGERPIGVAAHAAARGGDEPPTAVGGAPHANRLPVEGDVIDGHYRLVRKLGEGMFGCVYLAERTDVPEHRVALKVVNRAVYGGRDVERELVMLAATTHPHIVQLKDHGMTDDYVWLTMPLYEGETLAERLERGSLTLREGYEIFVTIARGVHALHERGLRHQDIKPENIFLAEIGMGIHPVLLDLGVAVEARSPFVAGTALYGSPEQIVALGGLEESAELSEKMDTYCLAATLLRSLVGPDDFPGERASSPFDIANALEERELSPLTWPALPDLTDEPRRKLRAAFSRWLTRDPEARPTAGELADELDVLLEQEREAASAIEAEIAQQKVALKRFRVALVAAALVGTGVALWGVAHRETLRLARELDRARAIGAASFDKLDTCVAAHQVAVGENARCDTERKTERAQLEATLADERATHAALHESLDGRVALGTRRLRACADEKHEAALVCSAETERLTTLTRDLDGTIATLRSDLGKTRKERDDRLAELARVRDTRDAHAESHAVCQRELESAVQARKQCDASLATCVAPRSAAPPSTAAATPAGDGSAPPASPALPKAPAERAEPTSTAPPTATGPAGASEG